MRWSFCGFFSFFFFLVVVSGIFCSNVLDKQKRGSRRVARINFVVFLVYIFAIKFTVIWQPMIRVPSLEKKTNKKLILSSFYLTGTGYATMTIVFLLDVYYCIIIAWTLFYLLSTFTVLPDLPWQSCGE